MLATSSFSQIEIDNEQDLHAWLAANHAQKESVWLVTYKKSAGAKYLSTDQVLDALLCYGWIDGIRRKLDEQRTMQLIGPRRVQHWSATYKARAARLIGEGNMQPAGLAAIEASKAAGLWDFLAEVDDLQLPDDLRQMLSQKPDALAFFEAINPSSKRFALRWLKLAKTEATRQKRLQQLLELSSNGQKLPGS